eukprot:TRINITY_DN72630_c0_g1_i1.p1 TRINITY_DN72630_c0_g1~~TRINITY_DN72630_c0_g1_i1.p1  ORF type:complete len:192 (-),score=30.57 TRINITY_DN72630_c0_g1_i1:467-994(-)
MVAVMSIDDTLAQSCSRIVAEGFIPHTDSFYTAHACKQRSVAKLLQVKESQPRLPPLQHENSLIITRRRLNLSDMSMKVGSEKERDVPPLKHVDSLKVLRRKSNPREVQTSEMPKCEAKASLAQFCASCSSTPSCSSTGSEGPHMSRKWSLTSNVAVLVGMLKSNTSTEPQQDEI